MKVMHMLHSLDCEVGDRGSTVRLSNKWNLALGTEIALCVCVDRCEADRTCGVDEDSCKNCEVEGNAVIIDTWYGIFQELPARYLDIEHEKRSRRYSGLKASMKKAYGTRFTEHEMVTVVVYRRYN